MTMLKDGLQLPPGGGEKRGLGVGGEKNLLELRVEIGGIGSGSIGIEPDEDTIVGHKGIDRRMELVKDTRAGLHQGLKGWFRIHPWPHF